MKRIFSIALSFVMLFSMGTVAFAETNNFLVTFKNEATYEIVIPVGGDIDASTGKGVINIDISNVDIDATTEINITATSTNYANGSWYLVDVLDNSNKLAYSLGTTEGGNDISSGDVVVSTSGETSATLYLTVSNPDRHGTFTDIITFTSEISEKLISFTFTYASDWSSQNCKPEGAPNTFTAYAEPGMTWKQWAASEYDLWDFPDNPSGELENNLCLEIRVDSGNNTVGVKVAPEDLIVAGANYMLEWD